MTKSVGMVNVLDLDSSTVKSPFDFRKVRQNIEVEIEKLQQDAKRCIVNNNNLKSNVLSLCDCRMKKQYGDRKSKASSAAASHRRLRYRYTNPTNVAALIQEEQTKLDNLRKSMLLHILLLCVDQQKDERVNKLSLYQRFVVMYKASLIFKNSCMSPTSKLCIKMCFHNADCIVSKVNKLV